MFSPDESLGRRRNWAGVYGLLSLMGLAVTIPPFSPTSLGISPELTFAWGITMFVGFGLASVAALIDKTKRLVWIENSGAWLGNAGLSIYVITLIQAVVVSGELGRTPQMLGFVALLVIMVSRAYRLQRHLKQMRQLKEIVKIAHRNELD